MSTLCFEEGFDPEYDRVPVDYVEPPEWDDEPMEVTSIPDPTEEEMDAWWERRCRRIQRQQEH